MRDSRPTNLLLGASGAGLILGGLAIAPETVDTIMVIAGLVLSLIAGNVKPDPPEGPPPGGRDMMRRAGGAGIVLAVLLAGCGHNPPGPPAHVETRAVVDDGGLDLGTRWLVCATDRVCAFVDVGVVWGSDGRAVCIELPEYGLLTCHEVESPTEEEDPDASIHDHGHEHTPGCGCSQEV